MIGSLAVLVYIIIALVVFRKTKHSMTLIFAAHSDRKQFNSILHAETPFFDEIAFVIFRIKNLNYSFSADIYAVVVQQK